MKASLLRAAWQFCKGPAGRVFFLFLLVLSVLTPGTGGWALAEVPAREPLSLITASGIHAFEVELAATPAARALGLMHRENLPSHRGMLFDFGRPRTDIAMWMKDTLIPLDMLFLGPRGQVLMIAGSMVPGSMEPVGTRRPVRAVLELAGGTAARLGIALGDRVVHRLFEDTP